MESHAVSTIRCSEIFRENEMKKNHSIRKHQRCFLNTKSVSPGVAELSALPIRFLAHETTFVKCVECGILIFAQTLSQNRQKFTAHAEWNHK